MNGPNDAVSIGLIGAGRIAQVAHLPAMAKAEGIRLVGVSDRSHSVARTVAAHYGVPAFSHPEDLLALDLDAVLIAVPDRFHFALGLLAIEAGKHVLMEKPLAPTSAEARELVRAATARGLRLQTGSMKRHDPGVEYARASVPRIGPILSLQSWYRVMAASRAGIQRTLFPPVVVDDEVQTAEDRVKADAQRYRLLTHGAHVFDGLRSLAGDLDWLSCHASSDAHDFSWHGTAGIASSGGLASFEITANVHSEWSEGFDIYAQLGHLRVRSPYVFARSGSYVELYIEGERVTYAPHFDDTDPFKRQLESFARAVRHGSQTDPSPDDGVEAVRLIEAAAVSASEAGRRVPLA